MRERLLCRCSKKCRRETGKYIRERQRRDYIKGGLGNLYFGGESLLFFWGE